MGYYIETTNPLGKAEAIQAAIGTKLESGPLFDPTGERVGVCVISNGAFEAASIIFSEDEKLAFSQPHDFRPKTWLSITREVSLALCPRCANALPPTKV